jgi:putative tricarboxylic transport membrane protein
MSEPEMNTAARDKTSGAWGSPRFDGLRGKAELGVAAGVVVLGIFLLVETTTINSPSTSNALGPKFVPTLVGVLLLVCGVWLAVDVLRGGQGDPEAGEDVDLSRPSDWLSVALVSAVFLLHAVLLGPLGWPIAGALLFWGVAASLGSRSWLRDGAVSVLLAVAVYLIFTRALGVYLPGGLLDGVL